MRLAGKLLLAVGCLALGASEARVPPGSIRFETSVQTPLILFPIHVNGHLLNALLDTGDALPFVMAMAPATAESVGAVETHQPPFVSAAVVGPRPILVRPAFAREARVGTLRLSLPSVGITSAMTDIGRAIGRPVQVVLGYDLLRARIVSIDYRCGRLQLDSAPPGERFTAALAVARGRPLTMVDGRLEGRPVRVVIDTGAAFTIIAPNLAREAGVRSGGRVEMSGAGGVESALTGRARIALGAGEERLRAIRVSAVVERVAAEAGEPVDVIAGVDLFRGRRLVLDYAGGRMWITPSPGC